MAVKPGVNRSESPNDKSSVNESDSLNDDGVNISDSLTERDPRNIDAENKRKSEELSELRTRLASQEEKLEEYKAMKEERLKELEEKSRLTDSEKREIVSIEQQVADIERDQRSKPWLELNKRQAAQALKEELDKRDFEDAMDLVEKLAKKEKIEQSKFEKDLQPYLKSYAGLRYQKKVEKAYEDYLERKEFLAEKAELAKREPLRRESNSNPPRVEEKKAIYEKAREKGDWTSVLKTIEEEQIAARKK